MKIRHLAIVSSLAGFAAIPAAAQTGPTAPPPAPSAAAPGSGNSGAMTDRSREENASYNRVIGTVGSNPVGKENAKRSAKAKPVPATAADITAGSALRDINGAPIGTIESADAEGAVIAYGTGKVKVPLTAFGKDDQGLLLGTTAEKFMALVSKAGAGS